MKITEEIKSYLKYIGSLGGLKKSRKKAIASRKNGLKGGRPNKK